MLQKHHNLLACVVVSNSSETTCIDSLKAHHQAITHVRIRLTAAQI